MYPMMRNANLKKTAAPRTKMPKTTNLIIPTTKTINGIRAKKIMGHSLFPVVPSSVPQPDPLGRRWAGLFPGAYQLDDSRGQNRGETEPVRPVAVSQFPPTQGEKRQPEITHVPGDQWNSGFPSEQIEG